MEISDIRMLPIEKVWEILLTEDDESEEYKLVEEQAMNGINIEFNLLDLINSRRSINIMDKKGVVIIINNGTKRVIKIKEFDKEIIARNKLMKNYLIENLEGKSLAKPRSKNNE